MNQDNSNNSQIKKGILEIALLLVLKDEMYVSQIVEKMKSSNFEIQEGSVYPVLKRLYSVGMLTYRWEESTEGPPRKYYLITDEGKKYLQDQLEVWDTLVGSINNLKKLN